ncbi:glutathione S-transferase family protein [Pigmentiphaga aceris]|uniref:Glutathione S-transferase family protein n=1 Tax=Pigmentiphaga aceris TaxID=1940612 RepID=A0A5C0AXT0_9BURK|nr:glutathione S-transferase family protein [Pigmentiphaga aceris]QEI06546.1 glutathione S-transferase family protein [Pigmentiphaga aceris]
MYELIIANKNYSSWSLRPWILLKSQEIPFKETLITFGDGFDDPAFRALSPAGKVPVLIDGPIRVWDSLAIIEYLAERHGGVWPPDVAARAWARSAAAEMHSGFSVLRERCSMSCGIRVKLAEMPEALMQDLQRIEALWAEGLARFGGPFLAGSHFTAVDAFFAPVVFRIQSYGLQPGPAASAYVQTMLAQPAMRDWYDAALAETMRDEAHEISLRAAGTWTEDLRAASRISLSSNG